MKKNILMLLFVATSSALMAQSKKTEETSFWVAGVCGMCEKTIENALDVKGVMVADYNLDTHQINVIYKPSKISIEEMHRLLNAAGYDTEKSIATEEQYNQVHRCCRYRELKNH